MITKIHFRYKLKIRQSIPILIGLSAMLILLLILGYYYASQEILKTAKGQLHQFTSSISRQDDYNHEWLKRSLPPLLNMVKTMLNLDNHSTIEKNIPAMISNDRGKQVVRIISLDQEKIKLKFYDSEGKIDISNEDILYYKNILEESIDLDKNQWFSIDIDKNNHLNIILNQKIFKNSGEFQGIVSVSLALPWYINRIKSLIFFEQCIPFFVSNNGDWTLKTDNELENLKHVILSEKNGIILVSWQNKSYICLFLSSTNNLYKIGVLIPREDIFGKINTATKLITIIGIIILLLAIYALHRTNKKLLGSLDLLQNMVGDLAKGKINDNENQKIELFNLSNLTVTSEQKDLFKATNQLRKTLKQRINDLTLMAKTRERIFGELSLARKIQDGLRPKVLPILPNLKTAAHVFTAGEVYGDMYDCFLLSENKICTIIGNVAEHGIAGAILTGRIIPLLREFLQSGISPGKTLEKTNLNFTYNNTYNFFTNIFVSILDLTNGQLTFASAGQVPPYILRKDEKLSLNPMINPKNPPLGIRPNEKYIEIDLKLLPNDILLFLSQRLFSIQNETKCNYSELHLHEILTKNFQPSEIDLNELLQIILEDVENFSNNFIQDDIMLFAMQWKNQIL